MQLRCTVLDVSNMLFAVVVTTLSFPWFMSTPDSRQHLLTKVPVLLLLNRQSSGQSNCTPPIYLIFIKQIWVMSSFCFLMVFGIGKKNLLFSSSIASSSSSWVYMRREPCSIAALLTDLLSSAVILVSIIIPSNWTEYNIFSYSMPVILSKFIALTSTLLSSVLLSLTDVSSVANVLAFPPILL